MSLDDRDWGRAGGGSGRFRQVLGRIFGDSENPLGWSLPLGTVAGIRVKVHLLFIVYGVAVMLWSIRRDSLGIGYTALSMGCLFVVVLLHEFGHCFACRAVGGEATEILMWPLGGLALCSPPHRWSAHLITTIGGPGVNVLIFPLTALGLTALGHSDAVFFNPFRPGVFVTMMGSWWVAALWWLHYVNLTVLGFNVLLPMFPLDGGRILRDSLWARLGFRQATETAVFVGFIIAGLLAVFGLVGNESHLFGVALFGGLVCWRERQLLRADAYLAGGSLVYAGAGGGDEAGHDASVKAKKRIERDRAREAREQAELDRILAKIAAEGMSSLTGREKRWLRSATDRRNRRAGGADRRPGG